MKQKNKPGAGRPAEGRVKLTLRVKPATAAAIKGRVRGEIKTYGQVLDVIFSG